MKEKAAAPADGRKQDRQRDAAKGRDRRSAEILRRKLEALVESREAPPSAE